MLTKLRIQKFKRIGNKETLLFLDGKFYNFEISISKLGSNNIIVVDGKESLRVLLKQYHSAIKFFEILEGFKVKSIKYQC